MRKWSALVRVLAVAAAIWLGLFPGLTAAASSSPAWKPVAPRISAGAAILMDWRTGEVLYEKNAHRRRDPASTTKVLTAIIALEQGKLDDQVKISRRAAYTPGSSMYIKQGDVYSLHDLLHGLLLRSGNDAATAIAEHIGGSVEAFAALMNQKAAQVGAKGSHFANPHGLTHPQHYSTAYDLAMITRYALQNEVFRSIVGTREAQLTFENLNRDVVLYNTNRLLSSLQGADGVKTGTTSAAGPCLIASATRDEQKLISVVLYAGNRWGDSSTLLEWGFANYRLAFLGRTGQVLLDRPVRGGKPDRVPIAFGSDLALVLPRQGAEEPKLEVQVQERIKAPLAKGAALGEVTVSKDGVVKAKAQLVAAREIEKRNLLDNIIRGLKPLLRWMTEGNML
jgi:serine-type D-Ala-D-Ala carboxypeptidase (penicillin-binding protein 5/6)